MELFIAIFSVLIGLTLVFGGYRLARIIIPLMGFIAGVSMGGAVISSLQDTPFLATTLGIIVGAFAGLLFAILAYLYYYVAVVVLTASLGYFLGTGLVLTLGLDPGVLSTSTGLILGLFAGVVAILLNLPKYTLMALTSILGAITAVGGAMLLVNAIPLEAFNYTAASLAISASFFWSVATLGLTVVGIMIQAATAGPYDFEKWAVGGSHDNLTTPRSTTGASHAH